MKGSVLVGISDGVATAAGCAEKQIERQGRPRLQEASCGLTEETAEGVAAVSAAGDGGKRILTGDRQSGRG